ncbi:hypothetical protein B4U80_13746 [Leptotrombidium deliense]|uniref:Uncharacterized protein n=1 Tax=Leptotrombidium deliense TaxID=299467 RepID=A0A443SGY9_9ACAR|nr:hypothetical protein B4U80_13746 [Leptotrombidium deliense]
MSPTFSTSKMKKMYPIIQLCCKQCLTELETLNRIEINNEIDVKKVYGNYILDVITKVAFAVDTNCDEKFRKELELNARGVFDPPWYRIIVLLLCKKIASKNYEFLNPEVNFFVRFVEKMINERNCNKQCEKRVDYLQLLLDDEMDSECMNNSNATTVNEDIAHLNIECSEGQHVNERGTVNYETLMKMQYLDACGNTPIQLQVKNFEGLLQPQDFRIRFERRDL